MIMAILLDFR